MQHSTKILIISLLASSLIGLAVWRTIANRKKNAPPGITTQAPVRMDIVNKLVIEGNLVPYKEVDLKTNMSGVIDKFYVAVGDEVKPGTPIARLKKLPTPEELEALKRSLKQAQRDLAIEEAKYHRNKQLFEKKLLAIAAYEQAVREWEKAGEKVTAAQDALDLARKGRVAGAKDASNIITATIGGMVSAISCEEGSIVSPYSTHNEGKPIATISDMSTMLF